MKKTIIILVLLMAGCDNAPVVQTTSNGCNVHDYGKGVFYFGCASGFGEALSEFRAGHKVVSITSYSAAQYGTSGYWVITE